MRPAGRNEEDTGLIHCFPEGFLGLFDSSYFARLSKVFVTGFRITWPVRFLEVEVGSPRPTDVKLMSGEVDRLLVGIREASFSLRIV